MFQDQCVKTECFYLGGNFTFSGLLFVDIR